MDHKPFPFLMLPAELRLMVYQYLYITRHHGFRAAVNSPPDRTWLPSFKHVTRSFTCSVLATCKLIHQEAHPLLACLRIEPTRFLIEDRALLPANMLIFDMILERSLNYPIGQASALDFFGGPSGYKVDKAYTAALIARCAASMSRTGKATGPPPEVLVFIKCKDQSRRNLLEHSMHLSVFSDLMRQSFSHRYGNFHIMWYSPSNTDEMLSCGYQDGMWYDSRERNPPIKSVRMTERQWASEWEEDKMLPRHELQAKTIPPTNFHASHACATQQQRKRPHAQDSPESSASSKRVRLIGEKT